ncbi:hypothetical protein CCR75_001810 [Bremia lactucae]|uniref:Pentacotripeptide-repeat region of PRORP domain-containing protein n=1 Tax=Bremia lactucae TaxID=4779 RepID=A0A976FF74_BRELC|nr:hypothetical protein CCR75_001810 [Bremia lactucae]
MTMLVHRSRRSIWQIAVRATNCQSQSALWCMPRSFLAQFATMSPRAVSLKNDDVSAAAESEGPPMSCKLTTSTIVSNPMNAHSTVWEYAASITNRSRMNDRTKCPAEIDRVSFRMLLAEGMRHGRVSATLRQKILNFQIFDSYWSDQELVMIVHALTKINRCDMALKVLFHQIKEPNRDRLNRVAAASARMGNSQIALGVLEIANKFHLKPDVITFTSAIHACARGGRSDILKALELVNEMFAADVQPNTRTYGAMILAYARMGCWDETLNLVNSISYTNDAHKKEIFTCAIISCSRNFQHFYALKLFELLLDDGIYPGDNVCNAALSSCARTTDMKQLRRIFKLVERHATPSTYSYNSMIVACGNARNMKKALEVLNKMQIDVSISPDVVTFNSLLLAAVRSRRVDEFPFILSRMAEAGINWDACTLNTLLEGCALNGDTRMAKQYWSQVSRRKKSDAVASRTNKQYLRLDRGHYETLMTVYYAAKDYQAIIDLWQKDMICRRRAKSSKTLNFLVCACKGLKNITIAEALMAEFAGRGQPISAITHHHMLEVFLAAGKPNAASAYLHKYMESNGLVSTFSFTVIMKYLYKDNYHSDVLATFGLYLEARGLSSKNQNPLLHYPTDAIYVLAMRSAIKLQDHETVLAIYGGLPATTSMVVRSVLLVHAVSSCENEGDWRTAVKMYDEMTGKLDEDTSVDLYKHIVKIVARTGEFDCALDVGGGKWYRNNRPDKGWGLSN